MAVLQDGGRDPEVVQFGRVVSGGALLPPPGAGGPVDLRLSPEFHADGADFGLLLELEGNIPGDHVSTGEAASLIVHVVVDVEVGDRLLEHGLKFGNS